MKRTFWDKYWRDEKGRDVIWQRPNKLLLIWALCAFITLFLRGGWLESVFSWTGIVALFFWAILEIAWGVNYFRKSLGFFVLLIILLSHF